MPLINSKRKVALKKKKLRVCYGQDKCKKLGNFVHSRRVWTQIISCLWVLSPLLRCWAWKLLTSSQLLFLKLHAELQSAVTYFEYGLCLFKILPNESVFMFYFNKIFTVVSIFTVSLLSLNNYPTRCQSGGFWIDASTVFLQLPPSPNPHPH